jgi:hypothetical protein
VSFTVQVSKPERVARLPEVEPDWIVFEPWTIFHEKSRASPW